ncbi:F-box/FBD/LRR-repeat protein At1g13570-like [Nicotiana sylvestris]|uniref:F-box/FBD/LRR-repeat protein At1g13570-like n=2 Tax=Nicotiana TaxID=4085 RepID=A0A1S4AAV2_TOBAC|nr:PREDICTED: F-box/FBD/LRR-repeat protein At1g13570-like [Nicotiana sylvestris]XP_016473795.1 PREDICTED: F-box/FBD/LRR-repeat protein At1g13570-like [Nicotiana tabacum]
MKHLKLHNCLFHPPPAFKGFNQLVSLELYEVTISSEVLGRLISRSLLLEQLVLEISSILNHIQIKAPKLRSFDFTGNIELICIKKAPLLVKLSLVNTAELSEEARQSDHAKYFESFPALEHLNLNYLSVMVLDAGSGDIAAKLSSPLNCLKCLCLSDICLDELDEFSYVLCLIRSSPYLQDIQMKIFYVALDTLIDPVRGDVVNDIPASFRDVTLNHLRVARLDNITGTKPEMELIKLLLAKSPMLVRMLLQPNKGQEFAETRLKVLADITKFSRASPKAEVDYNVDNNLV